MALRAPVILTDQHDLQSFDCGVDPLSDWLRNRALANEVAGVSKTYVLTDETPTVLGYYAISASCIAHADVGAAFKRNMPNPIPMGLIGRLAVDKSLHKKQLGVALLKDAVLRIRQAGEIMALRGVMAHAISPEAKAFYEKHGFTAGKNQPMTLIMSLMDNEKSA